MTFAMTLSLSRRRSKAGHETSQAAQNNRKKWHFLINIWPIWDGILMWRVDLAEIVYIYIEGVGKLLLRTRVLGIFWLLKELGWLWKKFVRIVSTLCEWVWVQARIFGVIVENRRVVWNRPTATKKAFLSGLMAPVVILSPSKRQVKLAAKMSKAAQKNFCFCNQHLAPLLRHIYVQLWVFCAK